MTQSEESKMQALEAMFDDMRQDPPEVPSVLTARVMMDAQRFQPAPQPVQRRKRTILNVFDGFGGWPALGGLAAASCVGFWIGISPPENVLDPAGLFLPLESELYYDPAELTGFGWDVQEG